jgi:hypothetical protein
MIKILKKAFGYVGWRCGSSSRAPALQALSSNPSPTKNNKKIYNRERGSSGRAPA